MIILTGAAGFIGSCMAGKLNNKGIREILLVDDFTREAKVPNYLHKAFHSTLDRGQLESWFFQHNGHVDFVLHLGARTDTTEFDPAVFDRLNLNYSKMVWNLCCEYNIPLVYASSAATYGDGTLGYDDNHDLPFVLKPLNPYGISKNDFDQWVLRQTSAPPVWYGLKFFNVYGPNEYHKGRMASVVFHAFNQAAGFQLLHSSTPPHRNSATPPLPNAPPGPVRLFRSHRPDYQDGEQLRDFIYVKDVTSVIWFLMNHRKDSGIYNLGTGKARTFLDLATSVFRAMNLEPRIEFIDTPADIRDKYQYFTEARMEKLRSIGYVRPFTELEEGVGEYVREYLQAGRYF